MIVPLTSFLLFISLLNNLGVEQFENLPALIQPIKLVENFMTCLLQQQRLLLRASAFLGKTYEVPHHLCNRVSDKEPMLGKQRFQ